MSLVKYGHTYYETAVAVEEEERNVLVGAFPTCGSAPD